MDLDNLLQSLGGFGRYHKLLFLSLGLVAVGVVWHNLIQVFTGAVPRYTCAITDRHMKNFTHLQWSNWSGGDHAGGMVETRACAIIWYNDTKLNKNNITGLVDKVNAHTVKCTRWVYSKKVYSTSVTTQWDLVCDEKWILTLAQSMHMAGCLIGSLVFGLLSDRFGRRKILLFTTVMEIITALATAFSPHWVVFIALRTLVGMAIAGQYNCAYIIAIEYVGPKWRHLAGITMMYFNSLGIMAMAGLAYAIRDWMYLQLALSCPLVLLLSFYWIAQESPRWLLLHNKIDEAKVVMTRVAKFNRIELHGELCLQLNNCVESKETDESATKSISVLKAPKLLSRTAVTFYIWYVTSIVYYGLSLNTGNLGGNDYMNFFMMGVVEIPAFTFCLWSLNRLGRRTPVVSGLLLSGLALLTTRALRDDMDIARTCLAVVGKFGIAVTYGSIYPFTAELFPTAIRNLSIGLCSMFARIGGLVAPCILLLGDVSHVLPLLVFGLSALTAGCLSLLLPETYGLPLPETVQDSERMPYYCPRLTNCGKRPHGDSIVLGMRKQAPVVKDT